jgi:hypothetical protein
MLRRPVTLRVDAVNAMITAQRLGIPHPVLEQAASWCEPHDTGAAMWAEFSRVGLTDGPRRLDGEALESLAVLGRPSAEYFVFCTDRDGVSPAALVAGGRTEGVLAYRIGDRVELSSVRHGSFLAALMRQVPDAPAARIDSLNVRTDHLAAVGDRAGGRDAAALLRLTERRMVGQGELYAGLRDHHGRHQVTRTPLYYQDLDGLGRVLLVHTPGYLTVLGATKTVLVRHLRQAWRDLRADG